MSLAALTFSLCAAPIGQAQVVTHWLRTDADSVVISAEATHEPDGGEVGFLPSVIPHDVTPPVASAASISAVSINYDPSQDDITAPAQACGCGAASCDGVNCDSCAGVQVNPLFSKFGCHMANRLWGLGCCKSPCAEGALGYEWLPHSPFFIERAQPLNHVQLQISAAYNQEFPDRSEFFWARSPGGGPNSAGVGEPSVDYQDFRLRMEIGGKRFSTATDIPIRVIDPVLNQNTAGFGDMSLITKLVLFEGSEWVLTQVFKSHFNTGSRTHGTGNGHVSLEPGVLTRWEMTEFTHMHSEVTFWFPLGADPDFSGEVIRYGLGFSHLWYDGDAFGVIPTLEFVGWTVLDGQQTLPNSLLTQEVDGVGILNVYPGIRFVFDSPGDWRVWDLGFAGGFAVTTDHWYEGILQLNLRYIY